ncbi:hypothetical protein WJX72_004584 [[Myrmecia] bisecta]|uniref:MYND-type domain-containing protein n=1 Tax=[Myrmecia] bisecta TaxID=41462 RepID=A0AAW1QQB7_9CHLO
MPAVRKPTALCAAESLKAVLTSKLSNGLPAADADKAWKAVRLCDRFLTKAHGTDAELAVLKEEVQKLLLSQGSPNGKMRPRGTSASSAHSDALLQARLQSPALTSTSRADTDSTDLDSVIPWILLEQRAHIKLNDFDKMTLLQDATCWQKDLQDRQRKREHQAATRAMLDQQMREIQQQREADRAARAAECQKMTAQIQQYQADEIARWHTNQQRAANQKRLFDEQVAEAHDRVRAENEREAKQNALERHQMEEELRLEKLQKARKAREDKLMLEQVARDNEERLQAKARQLELLQHEERKYNREYQASLEAWELKRLADQEAFNAKATRAFKTAGGDVLIQKLADRERADELRAERIAAEHEAQQAEQARQREQARKERTQDQLRGLDSQIAAKRLAKEEERRANAELAAEMQRQWQAEQQHKKDEKAQTKQRQRRLLHEQKTLIKAEARRRFDECNSVMNETDRKLHRPVMAGEKAAFNVLQVHTKHIATDFQEYGKLDGVEADMWQAVCGHFVDKCNDDTNADPDEWPVFSLLSPHHRMALVADVSRGLLCRGQLLPPDTIEHHAALFAVSSYMLIQIQIEIEEELNPIGGWDIDNLKLPSEEETDASLRTMTANAAVCEAEERIKKKQAKHEQKAAAKGRSKEELLREVAAQRQMAKMPASQLKGWKRRMQGDAKVFRAPYAGGPEPVAMVQVSPGELERCYWRLLFHAVLVKHHDSALVLQANSTDFDAWRLALHNYQDQVTMQLSPEETSLQKGRVDETGDSGSAEVVRAHLVRSKVRELTREFNASWTPDKAGLSQRTLEVLATDEMQVTLLNEKHAAAALAEFPRLLAQEAAGEVVRWGRGRWVYEWHALMQRGAPASYRSMDGRLAALVLLTRQAAERGVDLLPTPETDGSFYRQSTITQSPQEWLKRRDEADAAVFCQNCRKCEKAGELFMKCSRCKTAPYCSRECQIADWRDHKQRCAEFSARLERTKAKV